MKGSHIPLIFSFFFLIVFSIPIFYLIYGSAFFQMGGPTLTWDTFIQVMTSSNTLYLLANTAIYAVGGASVATVLAFIYAWIIVRTNVPGKRILSLLPVLPLTMPFLVKSFAWVYLLSPNTGFINTGIKQLFGIGPLFNIYSMPGMIFALGVGGIPLVYLSIEPAVRAMNPALEEASRVAGDGVFKTLRKVTIPILLPAILSAFMLLTIIGLENFDYPFMLGNPAGINTLATEVYFWIFDSLPPRYGTAAIISIIYIIITVVAVSVYLYLTRQTYKFVVVTGKAAYQTVHELRRWKWAAFAICFFIMFLAFILPFSTLLLMSFTNFISFGMPLTFTFDNYIKALNLPMFYNAIGNAVWLGLAAATLGTLIAAILSYAALKSKVKGARLTEMISAIPLAFPGIVYGLALFWTFLLLPGVSKLIYGTIWPLVIALIFVRLPYCVRIISGSLIQVADELEESSRVSGASWGRTFTRIVLPLIRKGLTNSFVYTFINSLRELGAVVILSTSSSIVLTTLLLQLYSQHAMALNIVAAGSVILSLMIIVVLLVPFIFQQVQSWRKSRKAKVKTSP